MVLTAVLLTFTVTLTFAWVSGLTEESTDTSAGDPAITTGGEGDAPTVPYYDAEKLQSVIDRYLSQSVVGSETTDLTDDLIRAFIEATGDDYASYMTAEEYAAYQASYQGNFVGIGVTVRYNEAEKTVRIVDVTPGSPAEEAGFAVGDCIVAAEGVEIGFEEGDDPITQVGELIRGEEGTYVDVTVLRDGSLMTITAQRRQVITQSVRYHIGTYAGKKVAYIAILSFDYPAITQFKEAIDAAQADGVDYIVYDLRNNGGGLLYGVLAMLTYILPDEALITTVHYLDSERAHRAGDSVSTRLGEADSTIPYIEIDDYYNIRYNEAYAKHTVTIPSAILINGYTASASELFTSTMRDYGLAVTVGENTYAKGCMQVTLSLGDGSVLKLTTAYYDPPCGINYDKITEGPDGITPDIELILTDEENLNTLYLMPHEKDRQFVTAFNALTDGDQLDMPLAERVN